MAQRRAIEMQTSAIALQAQLRMFTKHMMYKRMVRGMTQVQGMIRGMLARRGFRKRFGSELRPYRIRVHEAHGLRCDGTAHPVASALVTVVRRDALRGGAHALDNAQLMEAMQFQARRLLRCGGRRGRAGAVCDGGGCCCCCLRSTPVPAGGASYAVNRDRPPAGTD